MKTLGMTAFCSFAAALAVSLAFAAGDATRGKALFDDPDFAGGTAGRSCSSCHPGAKGAAKGVDKGNLRQTINACIVKALQGKAIDPASSEMDDIVAYLKSMKERP